MKKTVSVLFILALIVVASAFFLGLFNQPSASECVLEDGYWCTSYDGSNSPKGCSIEKDKCAWFRATYLDDRELCEIIQSPSLSAECLGRVSGDSSVCKSVSNPDDCYLGAAYAEGTVNSTICEKIIDNEKRNLCLAPYADV